MCAIAGRRLGFSILLPVGAAISAGEREDDNSAFKFPPIAAPHTFDLFGDVGGVDGRQLARAEQARLFHGPQIEVFSYSTVLRTISAVPSSRSFGSVQFRFRNRPGPWR